MLTLQQFIDKWTGKKCDFDGFYGGQCVDLYRQYVQEVLGVPQSPGVQGAKDIWNSYLTEYYDRISNTPDGFPLPGDIMIWGDKYGQFGHVAIVTQANKTYFTCFSQNDPSGALCGIKKYTAWSSTLGWLHPKPKDSMYKGYDLSNAESMKIAVDTLVDLQNGLLIRKEQVDQITNDLNKKLVEQATAYEKNLNIKDDHIKALEESLQKLQDTEHTWSDTADIYQRKLKAVVAEFATVDVLLAVESDTPVLVGSIHDYLAKSEADRTFVTKLLTDSSLNSPEAVVEALQNCKLNEKTIVELNKRINTLQKGIIRTITIGNTVIKIFKR